MDAPKTGYLDVLRIEAFRRLLIVMLLTRFGEAAIRVTIPLYVYDLTDSPSLVGAILVMQGAPRLVLAPIVGLLADRFDRRRIMIVSAILRAVPLAFLPLVTNYWGIGLLVAIATVGSALEMPAESAMMPRTIPKGYLVTALSTQQVSTHGMRVAGPLIAAWLFSTYGPGASFGLQAVAFGLAALALLRLSLPPQERVKRAEGDERSVVTIALADIADGLRIAWRTPIVRGVTAAECLWTALGAAMTIGGVVLTTDVLKLGDRADFTYGLFSAIGSAGAVLGSLVASRIERRTRRSVMLLGGYLAQLVFFSVVFTPPLWVLYGTWFIFGFVDAIAVIALYAYLMEKVEEQYRGRVFAMWSGAINLVGFVTYGGVGWLTARIGAPAMFGVAAVIVGIGVPVALYWTGAMQSVREPRSAVATGAALGEGA